jgi:AcrR family transcriptional regulator
MRSGKVPFRFDLRDVIARARRLPVAVEGVSINLPFLSVTLAPQQAERDAARELVVRLSDRRVLNASECCDNCIDEALASLQGIRQVIVEAQVALKDHSDGPLFLVLEAMLQGLRQFLTFVQRLDRSDPTQRQMYFDALEVLRGHLYRCLAQVATVAAMPIPTIPAGMRYDEPWQLSAYEPLLSKGRIDPA